MKTRTVITILFPTIFMVIMGKISFFYMSGFNGIEFKGIFILSLILLFPALFLIQGIICAKYNINVLLSLGVSILGFRILMIVYLNDSALIYLLGYVTFEVTGYLIAKIYDKSSEK
ncbi:hypothetical protein BJV38_000866 [Clostridium beijerinckii]|uniref:hypothetical protein n=1 Tax=Clostridium beijerinckii TaxID=1520 RepID=UPI0015714083|nr:hypothetical protein [Clostridium beijerinckii]NRT36546.1 hypothetical protein [Clostridium beijerinckii]NRT44023.1 hypothetical protein [Clostridium beijerinckii]NRZ21984.1 hypothetical protein [Clostridium beijerinckii]